MHECRDTICQNSTTNIPHLYFKKKLEKVKITGECFVNLKIIDDAFALVIFQVLLFLKIHLRRVVNNKFDAAFFFTKIQARTGM